ncbi:MAG: acetyl-CoA carboxylase biotin carboxyl carrier protein subunit, partial [Deltaproteobacteria bacterium]
HVTTSGDQIFVAVEGERFALTPQRPEATAQSDVADDPKSDGRVTTPMPGKIIDLLVEEGERVEAGAPVAILEAMKMESEVLASCGGTVTKIHVAKGDQVPFGQLLLEITP